MSALPVSVEPGRIEPAIRLACFFALLVVVGIWEILSPRRTPSFRKTGRWLNNLAVAFLDIALVRLLLPFLPMGIALLGRQRGWGLLNSFDRPEWLAVILGVLLMDGAIYLQHVMFHAVPLLWRLHRMHHIDMDFDVTTGLRFHPFEALLSMGIKLAVVAAMGPPAVSVLLFEVLLNATSMFNHGNVRIPAPIDRVLRWIVVTPDMHRVHHSVVIRETNSNFGFNFPWWDRLFETYKPQPDAGHEGMTIGLAHYRDPRHLGLPWMLAGPFLWKPVGHPINRPKPPA